MRVIAQRMGASGLRHDRELRLVGKRPDDRVAQPIALYRIIDRMYPVQQGTMPQDAGQVQDRDRQAQAGLVVPKAFPAIALR